VKPAGGPTRTRNAVWTYGTSVGFTLASVALALWATPLLLRFLGEERFGAVRAGSDWLGYLSLLEMGLAAALLPLLARASGSGDHPRVRAILGAGARRYAWAAAAMIAAGLGLAWALPFLVPVGDGLASELRLGCALALIPFVLLPLSVPLRALLEAQQRGYRVGAILMVQTVVTTALAVGLARSGWGIAGQFAALAAGSLLFHAAVIGDGLRATGGRPSAFLGAADAAATREIGRLNAPSFVVSLCGRVGLLTDNLVVAGLLGPVAVVPFFLTVRLPLLVQGQLQAIGTAAWAGLADVHARGNPQRFSAGVLQVTRVVAASGAALLAAVVAFNAAFVSLWVGAPRYAGTAVTALAALNAFGQALLSWWGWCLTATGRVRRLVPALLAQTAVNLGLSLALTPWLGLAGPLLGTLAGHLGLAWHLPRVLEDEFGVRRRDLARAAAPPLAAAVPWAATLAWLADRWQPAGWPSLAAGAAVGAVAFVGLWWALLLRSTERADLRSRLSDLRGGARAPRAPSATLEALPARGDAGA
jgi:O-antigen/teichoic acid export membrane protein